ncbi:sensor histidine kinase [Mucilaginibacter aquatilis]|uniref:histidine kinase n=1 Tax=Mucilaginibacter aquatilis TaxID=1517760 RepID=A0A6I4IG14_9SPHI|nr:PAS domain S-box protein [Mucilaginibacter aquatilis]MVN92476.1 PAS domain S-box protein [Mucilaginibacter aquatilis]
MIDNSSGNRVPSPVSGFTSNSLNYNNMLESIPVAIYTCNALGYITAFNNAAKTLWGFAPVTGKDQWCPSCKFYDHHNEPLPAGLSPMARAAEQGQIVEQVIIMQRPDGSRIKMRSHCVPQFEENRTLQGIIVTLIDVTHEEGNISKQARLAAIVDSSDDTILSKTLQGIITSWNKAAERMFGYTQAEAIGKHISMLIPMSRLSEEEYIIGQIAQGNRVEHFETIRVTKHGKEIPISLSVSPIKDESGNIIGASKIARDISTQKQAEDAMAEYARRLEVINQVIKQISDELDLNKILQKVIDATTELTAAQAGTFFYKKANSNGHFDLVCSYAHNTTKQQYNNEQILTSPLFSNPQVLRVANFKQNSSALLSNLFSGLGLNNKTSLVSCLTVPVVSRLGEVIGVLFFEHAEEGKFTAEHEDIVIPIAAQAAIGIDNAGLYEEVKFLNEKKDEFIGLASHELKTPLTSINGYLQILDRTEKNEGSRKFVTKTIQQVKKLNALVSDLLDVSKIEAGKLQFVNQVFNIGTLLDDVIELIQLSHTTHQIVLKSVIENVNIHGDPHRIEQVLINLLTNAIKYSHGASKVEVSMEFEDDKVTIGIRDFGIGIPEEKFSQIFSRFFRVEELNPHISGLGIGLYISHEIVARHNGKIWVESVMGQGSTFWLQLPTGIA